MQLEKMRAGTVIGCASFAVRALVQQFLGRVAEQCLLQYPDHRLSPARRGDQEALKQFLALIRGELLTKMVEFLQP